MKTKKTSLYYSLIVCVPMSIPCTCFQACVCEYVLGFVFSFWASLMYTRTGGRLHAELFVAGLAPWERILHLSILESRALILPKIHQRLTFFHSGIRPRYHSHCLLNSLPLSSLACTLMKTYLYTSCSSTHSGTVTVTPTHTLICNITWIDTREKQQIYY